MIPTPPANEAQRLQSLRSYGILDTPPEREFDELAALAAELCETPIAAITLVDASRQWFKANIGLSPSETSREVAFCAHAIAGTGLLVVPDATRDARFADNPDVIGGPGIRFYAGAPLVNPQGLALGTLCVIDRVPRELSDRQLRVLRTLGDQVMNQLEGKRLLAEQERLNRMLADSQRIAHVGSWETDLQTFGVRWSEETHRIFETDPATLTVSHASFLERVHPDDRQAVEAALLASLNPPRPGAIEHRIVLPGGREKQVEERWQVFADAAGKSVRAVGTCRDITESKATEARLQRLNRVHAVIGQINAMIVRVHERSALFAQTCELAVAAGGLRAAWIGLTEPEETTVTPVARAGDIVGYLEDIKVSAGPELSGRGPFGTAVREKRTVVSQQIAVDPAFAPWRDLALARGYRSAAVFPLKIHDRVVGGFALYADTEHFFDTEEVQLLEKLAGDVSFAIAAIDTEERSRRAEAALQRSEQRFREVFDQSPMGVFIVGPDYRFQHVNQRYCEILGQTEGELLDPGNLVDMTHADDRAADADAVVRLQAGAPQAVVEKRYVRKDGRQIWARLTLSLMDGGPDKPRNFLGIVEDITAGRDAQQERDRLFNLSPDLLCIGGFDGRFIQANPTVTHTLGWSEAEFTGRPWLDFVHPEDRSRTQEEDQRIVPGSTTNFANRYCCKDGSYRWLSWHVHTVGDSRLKYCVARDISRERKNEEQLRLLETCVDRLNDIVMITEAEPFDHPGPKILYVNDAFVRLTGYSRAEAIGRTPRFLQGPKTQRDGLDRIRRALETHQPIREEVINYSKSGEEYWLELDIVHVADGTGRFTHIIAVERDITERKHAEARLLQNQNLLRIAGRSAKLGGWMLSVPDHTLTISKEMRALQDLPPFHTPDLEAAIGFFPPEERAAIARELKACETDGTPIDFVRLMITAAGRRIWIRATGEAIRDATGRIVSVQGALQDITEEHAAAERASALDARLVVTLESVTDAFFTLDRDWRFTYLNGQAEVLLGRARIELLGRAIWTELAEAAGGPFEPAFRRAVAENITVVLEANYAPTGRWVEARAYPTHDGLAVYLHDVSEVRRSREALIEQATLLDSAYEGIIVKDLEDRIVYWNKGAERIYGWTAAEAKGQRARDLYKVDLAKFGAGCAALIRDGEWQGELIKQTKARGPVTVEVRWTLVRDAHGAPKSILAINADITERKKLEQQFLRAQRMESIGTLAGGIAHDLNNLLSPILMGVGLLRHLDPRPEAAELISLIETSAVRGADLVKQVLSFARGVSGDRVTVDLRHLIGDLAKILKDTLPKNITLTLDLPTGVAPVDADATQLNQVLMNLCVNARDAMPAGGILRLALSNRTLDHPYAAMEGVVAPGAYVLVEVTDNGSGMPPEIVDRIFEPFFTTKEIGKGTGLGLSTVAAIVKSHGGSIRVDSEVGKGTAFKVYLLAKSNVASLPPGSSQLPLLPRGHGQCILVVDDEAPIRMVTQQTLEAFGYRVLTAEDGASGLALFAKNSGEIDLILTDMTMPVLDGPGLIAAVGRLAPQAKIIAASGLNANGKVAKTANLGIQHFLPKPYTADTMLILIHKVLGGRPVDAE